LPQVLFWFDLRTDTIYLQGILIGAFIDEDPLHKTLFQRSLMRV